MLRKIFLLSASVFYLSQFTAIVQADPAAVISLPAARPQLKAPVIFVKAEGAAQAAAKSAAKKAKGVKSAASTPAKAAKTAGAKTSDGVKDIKPAKAKAEAAGKKVKEKAAPAKEKASRKAAKAAEKKAAKAETSEQAQQKKQRGGHETTIARQDREDSRSFRQSHSSSCVCVNHVYCVGPRGGHYCYTSGGNKRYLKRY